MHTGKCHNRNRFSDFIDTLKVGRELIKQVSSSSSSASEITSSEKGSTTLSRLKSSRFSSLELNYLLLINWNRFKELNIFPGRMGNDLNA